METEGSSSCSKGLQNFPILIQINLIHNPKPNVPKIHFNIIPPPTPRSSDWYRPLSLSN